MSENNLDATKKQQIERIDKRIMTLINLTEITRFKNIQMKNSFTEEFFKNMNNYINLK